MGAETDDKIKALRTEYRTEVELLARQWGNDSSKIYNICKSTNNEIINTRLEVISLSTKMEGVATKVQLLDSMATLKEYVNERFRAHLTDDHLKPPTRVSMPSMYNAPKDTMFIPKVLCITSVIVIAMYVFYTFSGCV